MCVVGGGLLPSERTNQPSNRHRADPVERMKRTMIDDGPYAGVRALIALLAAGLLPLALLRLLRVPPNLFESSVMRWLC